MQNEQESQVYVNRTINLNRITHIGLDMDHTLVRYHSHAFEKLSFQQMCIKLVDQLNYPKEILEFKFDFNKAIRGLIIDKQHGNLLKVSQFGYVKESYHGVHPIPFAQQRETYAGNVIDLSDSNFISIDTSFSISHANLLAFLVTFKDENPNKELPEYSQIAEDVEKVLDLSHRDDSIKGVVIENLEEFIIKDPKLVENLENYKKQGKILFIVTNSDFDYTDKLLKHCIDPFLKDHKNWYDLFEFSFTLSLKPRFFKYRMPLLKIDVNNGTLTNYDRPNIEPGVYQGGHADLLSQCWQVRPGQVLYIGDHIYGDVLAIKKTNGWRTGLVLEELNDEVVSVRKSFELTKEIEFMMNQKTLIESKLLKSTDILEQETFKKELELIDQSLSEKIINRKANYNPYWGAFMRAGIEKTFFASQVNRFADIYMATLDDLFNHSPKTYFRAEPVYMPHETKDK